MDCITRAVSAVLPECIRPIWEFVTNHLNVSKNLEDLDAVAEQLSAREADVKANVETAKLQGLIQSQSVKVWFKQVEAAKRKVSQIKTRYAERSPCLGNQFLINCWFNYSISADATDLMKVMQGLLNFNFREVGVRLPHVQEFLIEAEVLPKEEDDLQTILRYVDRDGDDIIGIWGMGGVGKTRLLKLVHNHYARNSSAFDTVIFLTASKDCSIDKLQAELCKKYDFGKGKCIRSQSRIISTYLSKKNFLVLVDDVWDTINLNDVGIPIPLKKENKCKRKVVITTRLKQVCYNMGVKEKHMLMVSRLDTNNALQLFLENVKDETLKDDPEKISLAKKMVHELDGLPLALITVGRAMRAKKHPREWGYAVEHLHEIKTKNSNGENIYKRLKFSYDSLQTKELKDCFLACSLFPDNHPIENDKLIELWCGLGIFGQRPCRDDLYEVGYEHITDLVSACLLEQDGLYKVKTHNVIRDMALSIACGDDQSRNACIVEVGVGVDKMLLETNHWSHARHATLLNPCKVEESIPRKAEHLRFLKVSSYRFGVECLIANLKYFIALTFLDLSNCNIGNFPIDSTDLISLRYLNLSNNKIVEVPKQLGCLINLEYLLLRNNKIKSFPADIISKLKRLRMLDLYEICGWEGTNYTTNIIIELKNLCNPYYLGITLHSVADWRRLLSELSRSYMNIRALSLYISDHELHPFTIPQNFFSESTKGKLHELSFGKMCVKKIVFENGQCAFKNLEQLFFDSMELFEEIIWKPSTMSLFPRLHTLKISRCGRLNNLSWTYDLPCLRQLHLTECRSMIRLIKSKKEDSHKIFPSLTHLILISLPALELISEEPILFPSLECICILDCPRLRRKLPFNTNMLPKNLTAFKAMREWWEQLEWEDNKLRMRLEPLFVEI